ncbi:NADase-type glycan-binding domain-containing protein [Nocardioides limicola]|uniref:NADase-type glycan-binding domain-containing protein n=1 Tax=Nocardioides limicola TaxID=2803368 RepID=UPI00193C4B6A|nr:zinc ribbon domain-containing protein [Nocardioides sp. DJM-14]
MGFCTQCGHALSVGRFCTNCGHPVQSGPASVSDTAERPAVRTEPTSRFPLYADEASSRARYPLFADEVAAAAAPSESTAVVVPDSEATPNPGRHRERSRAGWSWLVAVIVVLLVLVLGGFWLLAGGGPADRAADENGVTPPPADADPETPRRSGDVLEGVTIEVPATAPPGTSLTGERVDFEAANMVDGDPETTWRMPGDGTGEELLLTLTSQTRLVEVGLINGYAKTDKVGPDEVNWYRQNRRITEVTWIFDDGTEVIQSLEEHRRPQTMRIDPVITTSVRVRIDEVTAPGQGPRGRNFTAVSEIFLTAG